MSTFVVLAIIFYYPLWWFLIKLSVPVRMGAGDPPRFKGIHRRDHLFGLTGRAAGASTNHASLTSGSVSGYVNDGYGYVHGSVSTTVQVTNNFFLTLPNGAVNHIQLVDFSAGIGEGHVVSVAGTTRKGAGGAYFFVYNHTTNQRYWKLKDFGPLKPNVFMQVWLALNLITLWPGPVLLIVAIYFRVVNWPMFRSRGSRPMVNWLQQRAQQISAPGPAPLPPSPQPAPATPPMFVGAEPLQGHSIANSLKDLDALRMSGALTAEEFETAKARVLRP